MKHLIEFIIICLIGYAVYTFRIEITEYITLTFIYKKNMQAGNEYQKQEFIYFTETDNDIPKNKQDIINIIYTGINKGLDEFNFFCSYKYPTCTEDIKELFSDNDIIPYINNFISPYNTYKQLDVNINSLGEIIIKSIKYYDSSIIEQLNNKIDNIISEIITDNMSDREKLKAVHDYIINNTIYDQEKEIYLNTDVKTKYHSDLAIGPILEGYGVCSGYADAYSIFLDKLGIKNYRISNDYHIWNLVYLDGKWYHIDLTWDDPVTNTGQQVLKNTYFLLNNNELFNLDPEQHYFNNNIFIEAKA